MGKNKSRRKVDKKQTLGVMDKREALVVEPMKRRRFYHGRAASQKTFWGVCGRGLGGI